MDSLFLATVLHHVLANPHKRKLLVQNIRDKMWACWYNERDLLCLRGCFLFLCFIFFLTAKQHLYAEWEKSGQNVFCRWVGSGFAIVEITGSLQENRYGRGSVTLKIQNTNMLCLPPLHVLHRATEYSTLICKPNQFSLTGGSCRCCSIFFN